MAANGSDAKAVLEMRRLVARRVGRGVDVSHIPEPDEVRSGTGPVRIGVWKAFEVPGQGQFDGARAVWDPRRFGVRSASIERRRRARR